MRRAAFFASAAVVPPVSFWVAAVAVFGWERGSVLTYPMLDGTAVSVVAIVAFALLRDRLFGLSDVALSILLALVGISCSCAYYTFLVACLA